MNKKIIALTGALAIVGAALFSGISAANATTEVPCVPSDGIAAYDETTAEAYDETVIDIAAVDLWYSWTGGPSDDHAFPGADWQVDQGNHNGFDQSPGLLQRDKGNSGQSDWFYHVVIAEASHIVHHDAVIVHHDAVPPVICDPDYPGDLVSYSDWVDGQYECDDTTVDQTRTKSVTSYTLVDHVWVANEPVVTEQHQSRDLTETELADLAYLCTQPEPKVETTEWKDDPFACNATTANQTRTLSTTEYTLVEGVWTAGEPVVVTERQTRDLSPTEIAKNKCPELLAFTGVTENVPLYASGAALLLLLGVGAIARKARA